MATTYRVTFDIVLKEGHPRKWIPDTVSQGLEEGEDILNWDFREITTEVDSNEDLASVSK